MLGFLPGLGLGGNTHSLDVKILVTFAPLVLSPLKFPLMLVPRTELGGLASDDGELDIAIGDGAKFSSLGAILGPLVLIVCNSIYKIAKLLVKALEI